MTQLNDGSEARAEESLEESMRFLAVEVAWQLLWEHPNWLRGYGFAVQGSRSKEFLTSMRKLKQELERIVEWNTYNEQAPPRRVTPPDYTEVILIAGYLLLTNQKPMRPLPLLVGPTWLAMCRFYESENRPEASGPGEPDEVVDIDWTVDDATPEGPRTMH